MSEDQARIPEFLPTPVKEPPASLEEMVLDIYKRLAEESERVKARERESREQMDNLVRDTNRTIGELAAERFEFDRLLQRVLPALESAGLDEVIRVLKLYARSWDVSLQRAKIEVVDLTGQALTDELADLIDVESAIPDPAVRKTQVRKTLTPLIRIDGRVTGLAKVITSVPVQEGGEPD